MLNLNAAVEQTPLPVARLQAVAISAAGVNDTAALARQQLPNAVPAPALIAAYSANVPQQPKLPLRPTSAAPSSALAAQFMAQGVFSTEEAAELFAPRLPTPMNEEATEAPDDYLLALRIARGDVAAVNVKPTTAPATKITQDATPPTPAETTAAKLPSATTTETTMRAVMAQAATGLPALFTQFIRKPSIANVRGFAAYQLAEARNALTRKSVAAS